MLNPTNALDADLRLLDGLQCQTIITTSHDRSRFAEVMAQRPSLEVVLIPNLDYWLNGDASVECFPYEPTSGDGLHTPWLVIHTSGTTGKSCPHTSLQRFQNPLITVQNLNVVRIDKNLIRRSKTPVLHGRLPTYSEPLPSALGCRSVRGAGHFCKSARPALPATIPLLMGCGEPVSLLASHHMGNGASTGAQ